MQLSPVEEALNMQLTTPPVDADLHTYGFPPGYFVLRSVANGRVLDVNSDMVEDGTEIILWPETETSLVESMRKPESNNQVFFIDTSGALCSRSSGHAIDVEKECLVLRHRRPVSHPFPNAYSHPLPRFSYLPETKEITVTFAADPSYPTVSSDGTPALGSWREKTYYLSAIPVRKPRTIIDDASALISSALTAPLSFLGGVIGSSPTIDQVYGEHVDLGEDEILEQDRNEAEEIDDSLDGFRPVRVVALTKEEAQAAGEKAKIRRQWNVVTLLNSKTRTGIRFTAD